MLKLAIVAVSVVFLASTSHGLLFRGLKDSTYTSTEDEVYNQIAGYIELLEKKFAENSKIIKNSIESDVRPAVLLIAEKKVNESRARITKELEKNPTCMTEANAARVALSGVALRQEFPDTQTCVKKELESLIEDLKKSKQQTIEELANEKKKLDDGECYDSIRTKFGLIKAKLCCGRISEQVDRILQYGLNDMQSPNITMTLNQSIDNCKQTDGLYQTLESEIAGHRLPFNNCLITP